jgi:hypothetical protein
MTTLHPIAAGDQHGRGVSSTNFTAKSRQFDDRQSRASGSTQHSFPGLISTAVMR